jgi:hypothetical protein
MKPTYKDDLIKGRERRKPCLDGAASLSKCNLLFADYVEVANVVVKSKFS